jgi:ribose-phosphate pyrophosphokinase
MPVNFKDVFARTTYPSGETHLKKIVLGDGLGTIRADVRNFNDLCDVVVANRLMKRIYNDVEIEWYIPYFPFARDDRRSTPNDGFELELALDLVRRENLNVVILDPHSDVAGQLPHITQASVVARFRSVGFILPTDLFVIPDAGATKKAYTWLGRNDYVQGLKQRDTATGKLSNFQLLDADKVKGRDCVIVDDICDAGGTFLGLAKLLRENGAAKLTLVVSHGLFTKGREVLSPAFDHVYAASDNYDFFPHYPRY